MKRTLKWFLLVLICLGVFTPLPAALACHWGDCYDEISYFESSWYDSLYYPVRYLGGVGGCDIEIDD